MKLAVFDFDSTLMDGETIDILADDYGVKEDIKGITEMSMRGEIDFYESLKKRVAFLKGMKESRVEYVCKNLTYIQGAKEIITELKKMDYKVVVFSGGYRNATSYAKELLGFDADFSNVLHQKGGILSGEVGGDMMFGWSKGDMLQRIQALLNISYEDTIAVGDGANDASMFPFASKKIAFCAKTYLRERANIIIDKKDLIEILKYI